MQKLIYKKLAPIIFSSEFHNTGYLNITSDGFMPLVIERLSEKLISLSHYFESNGDLVSDPDMVVEFDRMNETANAVSYQDAYRYQDVRDEFDRVSDKKLQIELNRFLIFWLKNLEMQGFFEEIYANS